MEEWLEERKLHHDDYKSSQAEDPPSQSATTSDFDLIPVFPNEITQGPLMACLPWYMKPQLMTLNKSWKFTLNNPLYVSPHHKPYALKNSVIFYAHTSTGNGHSSLVLHIYQEGILRKLPLPPHIPSKSYKFTRFGITDQCVYSLTPASDQGKNMYSLNKLDLGGGTIKWQTLPPLPITGKSVHILSSISDDRKSTRDYIWIFDNAMPNSIREHRHLSTGERHSTAKENNWYALELHTAMTRDGRCHSIPPPPPAPPVENFSIHLPKYLDIYDTDKSIPRHLYKLFTVSECPLWVNYDNFIESHGHITLSTTQPRCLFVFQDDYDNCVIRGVHRICKMVNNDGSVKFLLYKRDLRNAEILEREELNDFYESWGYILGVFPPQQIRAVKLTADLSQKMDGWQQQFSLPSSNAEELVLNEGSTIKVAQQGTIYIYLYCAIMQGKDEIPIT